MNKKGILAILAMVLLLAGALHALYQSYSIKKDAYLFIEGAKLNLKDRGLAIPIKNIKAVRVLRDNAYLKIGKQTYTLDAFGSRLFKSEKNNQLFVIFWLYDDVLFHLKNDQHSVWLEWGDKRVALRDGLTYY